MQVYVTHPAQWSAVLRICALALVLVANGAMWLSFTRALALSPATLHVTMLNGGVNLAATAAMGVGVFGERVGWMWGLGAVLVGVGGVLMGGGEHEVDADDLESRRKRKSK